MRTFIAFDMSDRTREALRGAQRAMAALRGVRWARPEGIHLTVKFLGEIEDAAVPRVLEVMREAVEGEEPFEFDVRALGFFPDGRSPRVLWAGVQRGVAALRRIAERLDTGLCDVGVAAEKRDFKPHLTIGRARGRLDAAAVENAFRQVGEADFGTCAACELVLYMSELGPGGARYTRLGAVSLQEKSREER